MLVRHKRLSYDINNTIKYFLTPKLYLQQRKMTNSSHSQRSSNNWIAGQQTRSRVKYLASDWLPLYIIIIETIELSLRTLIWHVLPFSDKKRGAILKWKRDCANATTFS